MSSNNSTLFLLAALGVGALYLGSTRASLKENFDGFSLSAVNQKMMSIPSKGGYVTSAVPTDMIAQLAGAQPQSTTFSVGKTGLTKAVVFPGNQGSESTQMPVRAGMPGQAQITLPNSFLGSSAVTNSPYVSIPNYQQSANRNEQQGNIQLSSWQYVNHPSADLMGMSQPCSTGVREGYNPNKDEWGSDYPGVNYSAGNYNQMVGYTPCPDESTVSGVQMLGAQNGTSQPDIYVYDRLMTSTKATSSRNRRYTGQVDYIRGDLPIDPSNTASNTTSMFGYASAQPHTLKTGATQALGTNAQHTELSNFMKAYGSTSVHDSAPLPRSNFQTIPQLIANTQANQIGGGSTSVVAFS